MPKFFVVLDGAPGSDKKKVPESLPAVLVSALKPHGVTAESLVSVRACGGTDAWKWGPGHGSAHQLVQSGVDVPDGGIPGAFYG